MRIFQNINYIGSSTDIHVLFLEVSRFYLNQLETEDPINNLKKKETIEKQEGIPSETEEPYKEKETVEYKRVFRWKRKTLINTNAKKM